MGLAAMKTRFTPSHLLFPVVAIFVLCADATAATEPLNTTGQEAAFNEAMVQHGQGRLSDAYGRFAGLADHGHAEAARIALHMLRHGGKMYGHEWGASQPQIDQWMKLALQRMEPLASESGD
jgi:hypothetical protein